MSFEAAAGSSAPATPGPFGPFYLQELINSGGMADIWIATDTEGKTCALRKMHDHLRFNWLARQRFARGCNILSRIHNHEYVIGYIDHGKIKGCPYLLMEYLESSNLKQLFARSDPLLEELIGNILIDMALALEHVHDSGFMHCDFKPENVLVSRNGNLRLVDFDLSKPRPEKPKKMTRNPGTPAYMAPEQLQREAIDHRVDIFAFGVTAYELLTNHKPFPGETPLQILEAQLQRSGTFFPPRQHNPEIPAGLEQVVLRCLEVDPGQRYPIVSMLVHELKTVLYL